MDGKPFNSWNGRAEAKLDAIIIINVIDFELCILCIVLNSNAAVLFKMDSNLFLIEYALIDLLTW
jgi:hypothetical protein